jgi:glycogen operon protein
MMSPPLIESLAHDAVLGSTKLIAEAWDAGGLYQVGSFPAWNRWAEWNGKYRDDMRSFLKGDYWVAPEASRRMIGSPDLYSKESSEQGRSPHGYLGYN